MGNIQSTYEAEDCNFTKPELFIYEVTIDFADGQYSGGVTASTEDRALNLALTDARMGSPRGSFFGKLHSMHALKIAKA